MRELARLICYLEREGCTTLNEVITGKGYDKVISAVQYEAGAHVNAAERCVFKSPAFVLKVGGSLLECAQSKRGLALTNNDAVSLKDVEDFALLHSSEFTDRSSSAAHTSLRLQGNSLNEFPDEEDLKTLKTYQTTKISELD